MDIQKHAIDPRGHNQKASYTK